MAAQTLVRKYNYKIKLGEEPKDLVVHDATRWFDLRRALNELKKGDWLKVELTGEETQRGVEAIRAACYNWSDTDGIQLSKRDMRVQTATERADNGDVTLWARIVDIK